MDTRSLEYDKSSNYSNWILLLIFIISYLYIAIKDYSKWRESGGESFLQAVSSTTNNNKHSFPLTDNNSSIPPSPTTTPPPSFLTLPSTSSDAPSSSATMTKASTTTTTAINGITATTNLATTNAILFDIEMTKTSFYSILTLIEPFITNNKELYDECLNGVLDICKDTLIQIETIIIKKPNRKQQIENLREFQAFSKIIDTINESFNKTLKKSEENSDEDDDENEDENHDYQVEYIESDYLQDIEPSEIKGSKNHIKKKLYVNYKLVAEKKIGKLFKEQQLTELKKEILFMQDLSKNFHILDFYGYSNNNSKDYFVISQWMQYNLKDYLATNPTILWPTKLSISRGIADALTFCHQKRILHYNIKSENVLLDENLQPKLYNFGTKKELSVMLKSVNNLNSLSIAWCAPEVLGSENIIKSYNSASEVYSFAVLLWEISSHKLPFNQITSSRDITTKVLLGDRPEPKCVEGTPKKFQSLIEKGWSHLANKRPTIQTIFQSLNTFDPSTFHNINGGNGNNVKIITNTNTAPKNRTISNGSSNILSKSPPSLSKSPPKSPPIASSSSSSSSITSSTTSHYIKSSNEDEEQNHTVVEVKNSINLDKAIKYNNSKQFSKAWELFQQEFKKEPNSPVLKYWIGLYYLKGYHHHNNNKKTFTPDLKKAVQYLSESAKKNNPDAQYLYAVTILNNGIATKEHENNRFKVAMKYLYKASNQKHPLAMQKLGRIIQRGQFGKDVDVKIGKEMRRYSENSRGVTFATTTTASNNSSLNIPGKSSSNKDLENIINENKNSNNDTSNKNDKLTANRHLKSKGKEIVNSSSSSSSAASIIDSGKNKINGNVNFNSSTISADVCKIQDDKDKTENSLKRKWQEEEDQEGKDYDHHQSKKFARENVEKEEEKAINDHVTNDKNVNVKDDYIIGEHEIIAIGVDLSEDKVPEDYTGSCDEDDDYK
ncbi:15211_t:CDS:10 [Entrophospora sp. SA101]|nr:15211_t:CDS:10 [Entrophospora sp. SA101]